jgi:hypothetical protein
MPTSRWTSIPKIIELVLKIDLKPKKIIECGIGFGKFGVLIREYLEIWNSLEVPKKWNIKLDGIEYFKGYKNPLHLYLYDKVYYGDVMKYLNIMKKYDLVLCVDMIEHLKRKDGLKFLKSIHSDYIISTPINAGNRQCIKNTRESHISQWKPEDFENYILVDRSIIGYRINSGK